MIIENSLGEELIKMENALTTMTTKINEYIDKNQKLINKLDETIKFLEDISFYVNKDVKYKIDNIVNTLKEPII